MATAFLMGPEAASAGWSAGIADLESRGATEIVVVPLMVSSAGAHYRQVRYYAGEIAELPTALRAHGDHGPVGRHESRFGWPARSTGPRS